MRKFYEVIVNHRKTVIVVFFISVVICALCGTMVNVNYDMNDYLPDGTASILSLAGVLLWKISTHGVLSQLGHLLGRGTVLSTIIVLFVIPGMLYIFDTLIRKTTVGANFYEGKPEKKKSEKREIKEVKESY